MRVWFRVISTAGALALLLSAVGRVGPRVAGAAPHAQKSAPYKLLHAGILTVGSDTTYPPMESVVGGKAVGADVDIGNALAKAMGLKGADFVTTDFNTSIASMLIRHRFDVIMSSMTDNADRRRQVAFVDYFKSAEGILIRSSTSIHGNSYAAVCGHSVAVESGTTEALELAKANSKCKSKISVKQFTKDNDAYQAFVSRHTDAYTGDYPVVAQYVKQSHGGFKMAGKPFSAGESYGIALPKSATGLKAALTAALHKIRSNGTYARILKKWGLEGGAL